MDCPDEHLCEASHIAECLTAACNDPLLQLCGRLASECEGDDIAWGEPTSSAWREQVHDPARDHFGLPGAGASDQLKVDSIVLDCAALRRSQIHWKFRSVVLGFSKLLRCYKHSTILQCAQRSPLGTAAMARPPPYPLRDPVRL